MARQWPWSWRTAGHDPSEPSRRGAEEVWNAVAFGGLTWGWSLATMAMMPIRGRDEATTWASRRWASSVVAASKVEVVATGIDPSLSAPAYLVMANHTSYFDVPILYATLPWSMKAIAKKELTYIPVFGWTLALGGAVVIDRKSKAKAIASVARAAKVISAGQSVLLFPEGMRTPPGVLGPLKKGPFHLALAARVPVLPVGLSGTGDVLPKGEWRVRSGRVFVHVGTPIPTAERPDTDEGRAMLAQEVEASLRALMQVGNRG